MRPTNSATFTIFLVIALASTGWGQYGDSFGGQSGSAANEDGTSGDDSVTDQEGGFESSGDDADAGVTIGSASDQNESDEAGLFTETSTVQEIITHPLSNHILDTPPRNPDESPVQFKQPSDILGQNPHVQYPPRFGDDNAEDNSEDESSKEDLDRPALSGSDFNYIRKLRKMVDGQTGFEQSTSLIRNLVEEKSKLQAKLKQMESERIKLKIILSQLKGILSEMHQRGSRSTPNMTSHEIRIARLRNLFLILSAITNFTPLTHEQMSKINYDVGLFDPKITDEGKTALVERISTLLRDKFTFGHLGGFESNEIHRRFSSIPPRDPAIDSQAAAKSILLKKLRRLRNIYLLVRPLVTGVKLSSEELRELGQSQEGFFEPGLNDSRKIEIITRIAENIRTSHLSQRLIGESKTLPLTTTPAQTTATTEPPSTPVATTTSYSHTSVLLIRMAPKPVEETVHVSGKIQMDLNIEGDINTKERSGSLLSKLI